jgi:hypothetical protein
MMAVSAFAIFLMPAALALPVPFQAALFAIGVLS